MREPTTWIKLDRNIEDWRWFKDGNVLKVFLYLLLHANREDREEGTVTIHRGEVVVTQETLANSTGLSRQEVRTALDKLIATKDATKEKRSGKVVISIPRYDAYQRSNQSSNQRATNEQPSHKKVYINNINNKELKKDKNIYNPQEDIDWATIERLRECR